MTTRARPAVGLVTARLWRHSLRRPGVAYVIPTVMPLGLVVFISQLYEGLVTRPGYPVDDLLTWMGPGIVFLAATMGGGFTASLLVVDGDTGFLDRLRLLGLRARSLVGACLLFEGLRMVPVAVVLLAVAGLMGLALPGPGALLAVVVLSAVWAATWNAAFVVAALHTGDAALPQTLLTLFLPFFLASTIMVPAGLLPGYLETLAAWNPLDRFVVAARPLFLGGEVEASAVLLALGVAVALVAALGLTAVRQVERRLT